MNKDKTTQAQNTPTVNVFGETIKNRKRNPVSRKSITTAMAIIFFISAGFLIMSTFDKDSYYHIDNFFYSGLSFITSIIGMIAVSIMISVRKKHQMNAAKEKDIALYRTNSVLSYSSIITLILAHSVFLFAWEAVEYREQNAPLLFIIYIVPLINAILVLTTDDRKGIEKSVILAQFFSTFVVLAQTLYSLRVMAFNTLLQIRDKSGFTFLAFTALVMGIIYLLLKVRTNLQSITAKILTAVSFVIILVCMVAYISGPSYEELLIGLI